MPVTLANRSLHVQSLHDCLTAEDYVLRMRAIIAALSASPADLLSDDERYHLLCILEDHLPTEEQAKKFLEASPH